MPEIISRKEARDRGLKRYFTGKPCKYGHVCERYLCNARCVECERIESSVRVPLYREQNRELLNTKSSARYHKNPEKYKTYARVRRNRLKAAFTALKELGIEV